jgi:hypothetical protein
MNTAERERKSDELTALAMDEIRKFIAQRKTPALPKNAAITDYDLRAFDLEFSNSPTFVLTATCRWPQPRRWVVARSATSSPS